MSAAFPFRFYGSDPSEWEGDVYSYEVHFRAAPTEAERVAVARAFESALTGTSVDASSYEIRWAADWALFVVERRSHEKDFDYGLFFEDVHDAFRAVNGAAPVEEVVFIELIDREAEGAETGGPWHRWSVEQKAIPSDAPNWSWGSGGMLETLFAAKQTRFAVSPMVDAAVESARRDVWAAAARKVEEEKLAAMSNGRVVFETPHEDPEPPPFIAGSGRDAWTRGQGSYCDTRASAGSWLYAHHVEGGLYELYLGDDKKLDPIEPKLRGPDVRWAYGPSSLFIWNGSAIHEVDLATRKVQKRIDLETPVEAMAVLAGALVVIIGELTEQELVVYELGEAPTPRLRVPAAGKTQLDALLGGKVLAVHAGVVWGDRTLLLAYEDGRFHVMGASHERLGLVWEADGVVFAERDYHYGAYFEINNLEAARLAALRRAPEAALNLAASETFYGRVPDHTIEIVEA